MKIVGFDLGTHQTKICIQDATNTLDKTFEFMEFEKGNGETSLFLPSVVRVNSDGTLSYGFVDKNDVDIQEPDKPTLLPEPTQPQLPDKPKLLEEPLLQLPQEPTKQLPDKPKLTWIDKLLKKLFDLKPKKEKRWEEECNTIKREKDDYNKKCTKLRDKHEKECAEVCKKNECMQQEYQKQITQEKNRYKTECNRIRAHNEEITKNYRKRLRLFKQSQKEGVSFFRYFKLKSLRDVGEWPSNEFDVREITVWYIAYLLLLIKEKVGTDIVVQFGIPVSSQGTEEDKRVENTAFCLYTAAYDLADQFEDLNCYLETPYEILRENTNIRDSITEDEINNYIFDCFPEAEAGLYSLTAGRRLHGGFHILIDIGGGTTDMSAFKLQNGEAIARADIFRMLSYAKGLNSIFEQVAGNNNHPQKIYELQKQFMENPEDEPFQEAVESYNKELDKRCGELMGKVWRTVRETYVPEFDRDRVIAAIKQSSIVYCGGGSVYDVFSVDVNPERLIPQNEKRITRDLLDIPNLRNRNVEEDAFPILAISYGLALYERDYENN